jgi:hypothetical protein
LLKKVFFVGVILSIEPGSPIQLVVGAISAVIMMLYFSMAWPYKDDDDNKLQMACLAAIFVTYFMMLMLNADSGFVVDQIKDMETILVAANLIPLFMALYYTFRITLLPGINLWIRLREVMKEHGGGLDSKETQLGHNLFNQNPNWHRSVNVLIRGAAKLPPPSKVEMDEKVVDDRGAFKKAKNLIAKAVLGSSEADESFYVRTKLDGYDIDESPVASSVDVEGDHDDYALVTKHMEPAHVSVRVIKASHLHRADIDGKITRLERMQNMMSSQNASVLVEYASDFKFKDFIQQHRTKTVKSVTPTWEQMFEFDVSFLRSALQKDEHSDEEIPRMHLLRFVVENDSGRGMLHMRRSIATLDLDIGKLLRMRRRHQRPSIRQWFWLDGPAGEKAEYDGQYGKILLAIEVDEWLRAKIELTREKAGTHSLNHDEKGCFIDTRTGWMHSLTALLAPEIQKGAKMEFEVYRVNHKARANALAKEKKHKKLVKERAKILKGGGGSRKDHVHHHQVGLKDPRSHDHVVGVFTIDEKELKSYATMHVHWTKPTILQKTTCWLLREIKQKNKKHQNGDTAATVVLRHGFISMDVTVRAMSKQVKSKLDPSQILSADDAKVRSLHALTGTLDCTFGCMLTHFRLLLAVCSLGNRGALCYTSVSRPDYNAS